MADVHVFTYEPLLYILNNMREEDRRELAATQRFASLEDYASALLEASSPYGWIVYADDGEPVHAIGCVVLWPGVVSAWSFGTDRTPEVLRVVTRHALEYMFPSMRALGVHRAECRSLADRDDLKRWFSLLGFVPEAVCSGFGSGREDFILYAWTDGEAQKAP